MAAVAMTFASYTMLLKLAAIVTLIVAGFVFPSAAVVPGAVKPSAPLTILAAMTPVMFAYGGWQTASFMSGELKNPRRDLAIGLLAGVAGVITVYLLVNYVCLRVLGPAGLAATPTPASTLMRTVMGERGATFIAAGIAISTLGFLSQGMLTAPRVYYAMAEDGVFFRAVGKVHPRTRVPILAIVLQGAVAIAIAATGTYKQILNYVVSVDFIFFGLTGLALFAFRRRGLQATGFRTPLHPWSTAVFVIACWLVVFGTFAEAPVNSAIGLVMLAAGLPAWWLWSRKR
jgi:APA family basic amino acid/polyamine antiporter